MEETRALLERDRATALKMIAQAGERNLNERMLSAPWTPQALHSLGWHIHQMVLHLDRHRCQLYYYLKLQGAPVTTADLWG